MANSTIPNLPLFSGNPVGSEVIETVQSGASVHIPSQKIADLAKSVVNINLLGMQALVLGGNVDASNLYLITDAVGGTSRLLVKGATVSSLESGAMDLTTGAVGTYVLGTDTFTVNSGDSWVSVLVSANIQAENNTQYIVVADSTFTDPIAPQDGKGYIVYVRNGKVVLGGATYSKSGSVIWRVYHSGAWESNYINRVEPFSLLEGTPSTYDDTTLGYEEEFRVKALEDGITYVCKDNTAGAAVWEYDTDANVSYYLKIDAADVLAGGVFDIPQLPELKPGYFWEIITCTVRRSGATTPYDGSTKKITLQPANLVNVIFYADVPLTFSNDGIFRLFRNDNGFSPEKDCYAESEAIVAIIDVPSTVGDGDIHVYGLARIVKMSYD